MSPRQHEWSCQTRDLSHVLVFFSPPLFLLFTLFFGSCQFWWSIRQMTRLHRWLLTAAIRLLHIYVVKYPKTPFWGREQALSSLTRKIVKLAYHQTTTLITAKLKAPNTLRRWPKQVYNKPKTADGRLFKTLKLQYLCNCVNGLHEMWCKLILSSTKI